MGLEHLSPWRISAFFVLASFGSNQFYLPVVSPGCFSSEWHHYPQSRCSLEMFQRLPSSLYILFLGSNITAQSPCAGCASWIISQHSNLYGGFCTSLSPRSRPSLRSSFHGIEFLEILKSLTFPLTTDLP